MTALEVVKRLVDSGHTAYYAGGWVRDLLLGEPSSDIDIATSATPDQVMELFEKTVPVGLLFGSVVVVEGGESFEVTTFRTESGYHDGRRPDNVAFSSAREDALRRSITINGMFYDPLREEVIDYVGGKADLEAGIIRAIGEPDQRFTEDKLRMIRAIRFATRFDFTIEPETWKAICVHAHELFPAVAVERVWQELQKMGRHPRFPQFLQRLHDAGLLQQIFPEASLDRLPLLRSYPESAPTILRLMELFEQPDEQVAARLKVSKDDLRQVRLLRELDSLTGEGDLVRWVHFYAEPEAHLLLEVRALRHGAPYLKQHLQEIERLGRQIRRVQERRPLVTAAMLQELGVKPGREMGRLLREAERIAIEQNLESAESVLSQLTEF